MAAAGGERGAQTAAECDRDSGYSDVASECRSSVTETDAEDGPSTLRGAPGASSAVGPQTCTNPLLVLRNVPVDQVSGSDPQVHFWSVRPSFQLFPSSSQLLVFPTSVAPGKPPPAGRATHTYLPILNSYPRIAPHPSPQAGGSSLPHGGKRRAHVLRHHQPKRLLTLTPSAKQSLHHKVPEERVPAEGAAWGGTPGGSLGTEGGCDTTEKAKPPLQKNSRRFQNAPDAPNRSGLFSIAVKTKELARLSQATQAQLEKLQQQVALFSRAVSSNDPQDWRRLQDSLAESAPPREIEV